MDDAKETVIPEGPPESSTDAGAAGAGAAAGPEENEREHPQDEWAQVRTLALRQLDRFMSLEPRVLRGDDPDAIHDMRVASRRLQQVLDLLYPTPRPREIRSLRKKIRRCRRALSEVRNCDVLILRLDRFVTRKRATHRETWTAIQHYLRERRSESFERAVGKLGKVNLAVFYVHLKGHIAPNGSGPEGRLRLVDFQRPPSLFCERLGEALGKASHGFETQITRSHSDRRARVIHSVRIAAKRLRYLIEVVREFNVPGSAEMLGWLRTVQQHLGDWHDLEVLEQMMIEMVARPEFLRDHLETALRVEKLILKNRAAKRGYEEKYFRMTQDSSEFRRMEEWLAHLVSSPSAAFAKV